MLKGAPTASGTATCLMPNQMRWQGPALLAGRQHCRLRKLRTMPACWRQLHPHSQLLHMTQAVRGCRLKQQQGCPGGPCPHPVQTSLQSGAALAIPCLAMAGRNRRLWREGQMHAADAHRPWCTGPPYDAGHGSQQQSATPRRNWRLKSRLAHPRASCTCSNVVFITTAAVLG